MQLLPWIREWRDPQDLGLTRDAPVPNPSVKYRCCGLLDIPCGQTFRNALFPPSDTVVEVVPWGDGFMGLTEMSLWLKPSPCDKNPLGCHELVAGRRQSVGMWGNGQWAACSLCHWWGHVWARNNYICPEMGSQGSQPPSCSNAGKLWG